MGRPRGRRSDDPLNTGFSGGKPPSPPDPPEKKPKLADFDPDELLTIQEVAKLIKVSVKSIQDYVAVGTLPRPIRFSPRCLRWRASELRKWIEKM